MELLFLMNLIILYFFYFVIKMRIKIVTILLTLKNVFQMEEIL